MPAAVDLITDGMQASKVTLGKQRAYVSSQITVKVKVKVNVDLYRASNALSSTRSQGISQFYLHYARSSANEINCLLLKLVLIYDLGWMEG